MAVGKEAYTEIRAILDGLEEDLVKFYDKGTSSAGGRLRKSLAQIVKTIAAEKKNILEVKKERQNK